MTTHSANKRNRIATALIQLLTCGLVVLWSGCSRQVSVTDYVQQVRLELENDLRTNNNKYKTCVEGIHPLVTYKKGVIKSLRAATIDGSNNAGPKGNNISELNIVLTFYWDGPIQRNGYTEISYVFDTHGNLKHNEVVKDTGMTSADWYRVGYAVGAAIALLGF